MQQIASVGLGVAIGVMAVGAIVVPQNDSLKAEKAELTAQVNRCSDHATALQQTINGMLMNK